MLDDAREVILQALSQGKKKFAEFNRQLIEQLVGVRKIVTPPHCHRRGRALEVAILETYRCAVLIYGGRCIAATIYRHSADADTTEVAHRGSDDGDGSQGRSYYRRRNGGREPYTELLLLGVHRDCLRHGLGTALAEFVKQEGRERGSTRLVVVSSTSTVPFWTRERLGFRQLPNEATLTQQCGPGVFKPWSDKVETLVHQLNGGPDGKDRRMVNRMVDEALHQLYEAQVAEESAARAAETEEEEVKKELEELEMGEEEEEEEKDGSVRSVPSGRGVRLVLRSLFAGCTERAEIVEYVTAHSDFGADTKHGARSAIADVITCEVRKQEQSFWRLANDGRLLLTAEGEALRGSKELQEEEDEPYPDEAEGYALLKTDRGVSGYVGVKKMPGPHRYTASVQIDGRKVHLGIFPIAWKAALARAQRLGEPSQDTVDVEAEGADKEVEDVAVVEEVEEVEVKEVKQQPKGGAHAVIRRPKRKRAGISSTLLDEEDKVAGHSVKSRRKRGMDITTCSDCPSHTTVTAAGEPSEPESSSQARTGSSKKVQAPAMVNAAVTAVNASASTAAASAAASPSRASRTPIVRPASAESASTVSTLNALYARPRTGYKSSTRSLVKEERPETECEMCRKTAQSIHGPRVAAWLNDENFLRTQACRKVSPDKDRKLNLYSIPKYASPHLLLMACDIRPIARFFRFCAPNLLVH